MYNYIVINFEKWKENWIKNVWPKIEKENIKKYGNNTVKNIEQEDLYQNFYKKYKVYPDDFFSKIKIDWIELEEIYNMECVKKHFLGINLIKQDKNKIFNKKHYIVQLAYTELDEKCLIKIAKKLKG